MRAACLKQHRRKPVWAMLRHDEIGTISVVAADLAEHLPAAPSPPMRAMRVAGKTTLIKIHHVSLAVLADPKPQRAKI